MTPSVLDHLKDDIKSFLFRALVSLFTALSSVLPRSCQPLTQQLQDISSVTVAVVNLEYDGSILPVMVRIQESTKNTSLNFELTRYKKIFTVVKTNYIEASLSFCEPLKPPVQTLTSFLIPGEKSIRQTAHKLIQTCVRPCVCVGRVLVTSSRHRRTEGCSGWSMTLFPSLSTTDQMDRLLD